MSAVTVRPALSGDADRVAELGREVAAQPLLRRYGVTPEGLSTDLRRLAEYMPDPAMQLLLAESGEHLCGIARVQLRGTLGPGAYLQLIALRPGQEGRGTGTALLRAVEACAQAHSAALFLLTSDFNQGAQRFYERHGYEKLGHLPDYVLPGITELLYWKLLHRPHTPT